MGYLSDWTESENAAQAAHEANPDCDESGDCPAAEDGHLLTCRTWRRARASGRAAVLPTHMPRRGSDVEAWLVHWRDAFLGQDNTWAGGTIHSNNWHVLDDLLDRYRLLADTGATLESDGEEQ